MKLLSRYILILFLSISSFTSNSYGQGLGFRGNNYPIDERTSYNVFSRRTPAFSDKLNISFDITISEPSRLGYIIRLKSKEPRATYNLSYYNSGDAILFKFNEEGKNTLITANFKTKDIPLLQWFKIDIAFDLNNNSLQLTINNNQFRANGLKLTSQWSPDICFGKSDHIIDVPSFSIRQLVVSDEKQRYEFPLKENRGGDVHTSDGKLQGYVDSPVWLINQSYYWTYEKQFRSQKVAGYNFNAEEDNLYIINSDSLVTYNFRSGDIKYDILSEECPVDIFSGTNFIDPQSHKLYIYEVHTGGGRPSVASLDMHSKMWNVVDDENLPMHLHHHSVGHAPDHKRYYIFGGYGDVYYSKELYSFNYETNKWSDLSLTGDFINPRYFSSMGYSKSNNSLYLYGGMGNESGEQIVGREYFYDLYRINLDNNVATKLWEIPWAKENVVPVREMVIQNDSCFYTLCYPEHFSNSYLKLFRFSLADGAYQILGDSIPIRSEKIKTKANLYYSHNLNKLYAIVQEFDDNDISSNIKVYSLAFPPIDAKELEIYSSMADSQWIYMSLLGGLLVLVVILLVIVVKKKKSKSKAPVLSPIDNVPDISVIDSKVPPTEYKGNSIYLFGEFMVRDKSNRDITYMFSAKLKHTFLFILQYSSEGGISSQRLSELLWPDKSEDKVKNSRGVTLNLLRKIFKELDGIALIYEKGLFRIDCDDSCYCDYVRCLSIIDSDEVDKYCSDLIDIVSRGKFLKAIDQPEFDVFKQTVEQKLEPVLLIEIEKCFTQGIYKSVVDMCNAVFGIDPINPQALYYAVNSLVALNMDNEAKKLYLFFTVEYRKMIGVNYPHTFTDVLESRFNI